MEFKIETIGTSTFLSCEIRNEETNTFALKMIENNEISGILPFSCIQKDRIKTLRYSITSRETLEAYICRPLPISKIWNIWESIAAAVLELEAYMLDTDGLVLDMSYMYTEIRSGKTELVYVPVKGVEGGQAFEFLKDFPAKIQYEDPENAVSILKISNEINSGKITEIKSLLDAIKKAKEESERKDGRKLPDMGKESNVQQQAFSAEFNGQNVNAVEREAVQQSKQETGRTNLNSVRAEQEIVHPAEDAQIQQGSVEHKKASKEKKSFSFFGKDKTEKNKKAVSQPVIPGFAIPGMDAEQIIAPAKQEEKKEEVKQDSHKKGIFGFSKKDKAKTAVPEAKEDIAQAAVSVSEQPAVKSRPRLDFGQTVIYEPEDDATVIDGLEEPMGISYLLRRSNGQKMYLEKEIVKIGRESAYVDLYIGDNPRVGRNHAEVIKKENRYFIKDNNSKNHTFVNGQMVEGGAAIELHSGDEVTFANESFTFYEN